MKNSCERESPQKLHSNVTGGGSLGCQTLYHLAKLGVTNTVLLEKEQLTAGQPAYPPPIVLSWPPKSTRGQDPLDQP